MKQLYKQQLLLLNDKLVIDRKYDILRENYNVVTNNHSKRKFKFNRVKKFINQRYNPLFNESKNSMFNQQPINSCSFLITDLDKSAQVNCTNSCIPLSNYCIERKIVIIKALLI